MGPFFISTWYEPPDNLSKELGVAIQDCLRKGRFLEKYPSPLGSHLSRCLICTPTTQCVFLPPVCEHSQIFTHTPPGFHMYYMICAWFQMPTVNCLLSQNLPSGKQTRPRCGAGMSQSTYLGSIGLYADERPCRWIPARAVCWLLALIAFLNRVLRSPIVSYT